MAFFSDPGEADIDRVGLDQLVQALALGFGIIRAVHIVKGTQRHVELALKRSHR